ncbi:MAG: transposase, partial [Hyphomonadaceae bacterium]
MQLELKTPWRDGTTHLVLSPLEFMQRLAALVPRPRLHLIRYHGVLAATALRRVWPRQAAGVADRKFKRPHKAWQGVTSATRRGCTTRRRPFGGTRLCTRPSGERARLAIRWRPRTWCRKRAVTTLDS